MEKSALKISGVSKHFGGVKALSDINLDFGKGEIIGLIGSNGAGKSTLLNVIWGAFAPDEGQIFINGKEQKKITPEKAHKLGISIIFQHRCLMPYMTVAENIFIDEMPKRNGIIDYKKMHRDARKLLDMLELDIDSRSLVFDLTAEEKQLVEIAKACSRDPKILLMDEPTTALRQQEVETLFGIMRNLKAKGCSVVFISHRLKEVVDVCDRISIIRDGRNVIDGPVGDFTAENIVDHMSGIAEKGEALRSEIRERTSAPGLLEGKVLLKADELSLENVNRIGFELHEGEILGFAGLGGSGIDDLFGTLFGLKKSRSGEISVKGVPAKLRNPMQAVRSGIGFVPEDRQLCGEFLGMTLRDNICITSGQKRPYFSSIRRKAEKRAALDYIRKLAVKTESDQTLIKNLSGGNQQKAIIAKWLDIDSDIILMSEPTAGIDVSAKGEVNRFITKIAGEGKGIIYTSSYITELMDVADRIIVVYKGEIFKEFRRSDFDHNQIYLAMNGIGDNTEIRGAEQ